MLTIAGVAGASDRRERRCGLALELFTAPEPADLARARKAAESQGDGRSARVMRWPKSLPAYMAVLPNGTELLLWRPVGADSMVLHRAGVPYDDSAIRLVAPIGGFVGCSDGACLWYDRREHRLAFHRLE